MSSTKCVVEGCNLEYDVICSFSFYNTNVGTDKDAVRQEWIEGAMKEESECLWRHVSLQLCGYHFELDTQGLWIDSPMLPELLKLQKKPPKRQPTEEDKRLAEIINFDHNYCQEEKEEEANISRLNVRSLVDTLGYLSLKNLQRKQLWVVKVETDKAEASITQAEQVISKMQEPKQIIEIVPQTSSTSATSANNEVLQIMDESAISDNFIYEIAEEQEIAMDEVKEIPATENHEWMVNIIPETPKPKYAYIKHVNSGKKKRHFTTDMDNITLAEDFENYYILPDADPSVGVEITTTTSYEQSPNEYIIQEFKPNMVFEEKSSSNAHPRKRGRPKTEEKKTSVVKKKKTAKQIEIKSELGEDWIIENNVSYDQDSQEESNEESDKGDSSRVRRKNQKYLGYDFVT